MVLAGVFSGNQFAVLLLGLFFYFIPSFVARFRGVRNFTQVFFLNLLLGWSVIGWIFSLVWALKPVQ